MIRPSTSPITLTFGATTEPYNPQNPHRGVDFSHKPNPKIYAPFSGQVIIKENNGNDGNAIYMQNGTQFHGLLHLSRFLVKDGESVEAGQVIGVMGDTGKAEGVHLHWAVKVNGKFIDPLTLLKEDGMTITDRGMINALWSFGFHRKPTEQEYKNNENRPLPQVLRELAEFEPKSLEGITAARQQLSEANERIAKLVDQINQIAGLDPDLLEAVRLLTKAIEKKG